MHSIAYCISDVKGFLLMLTEEILSRSHIKAKYSGMI